jgi:hypothetical protein
MLVYEKRATISEECVRYSNVSDVKPLSQLPIKWIPERPAIRPLPSTLHSILLPLSLFESSRVWQASLMSNGQRSWVRQGTSMHHEVDAASCASLNMLACRNQLLARHESSARARTRARTRVVTAVQVDMHPKANVEPDNSGTHCTYGWNLVRDCSTAAP